MNYFRTNEGVNHIPQSNMEHQIPGMSNEGYVQLYPFLPTIVQPTATVSYVRGTEFQRQIPRRLPELIQPRNSTTRLETGLSNLSQSRILLRQRLDEVSVDGFARVEDQPMDTTQSIFIEEDLAESKPARWNPKLEEVADRLLLKCMKMFQEKRALYRIKNGPEDSLKFRRRGLPKDTMAHIKALTIEAAELDAQAKMTPLRRAQNMIAMNASMKFAAKHVVRERTQTYCSKWWRREKKLGFREKILEELREQKRMFLPDIHRGTEEHKQPAEYHVPDRIPMWQIELELKGIYPEDLSNDEEGGLDNPTVNQAGEYHTPDKISMSQNGLESEWNYHGALIEDT
ncbi:MAG: hypothetical protein Q9218_006553 [Villophora microphyllina]